LLALLTCAAADKKLPDGKALLPADTLKAARRHVGPKPSGEMKTVDVEGQPFKQAIRAVVKETPENPWTVQVSTLTVADAKEGDVVLASFWARCAGTKAADGKAQFLVYFGIPESDLDHAMAQELSIGPKWTRVQVPARVPADFASGKAMLNLDLGYAAQTVELADIKLTNYGKTVKLEDLPSSGF
jgi:hypothetical protein